jgi:hypothetical protein
MDDNKMIPYIAFESATSRQERTIRRVWILCIILIIALIGTNAGWIYWESQWEDVVVTQENADGYNNYIGNDGDITN